MKALELDRLLPEAHLAAAGISFLFEWDWLAADRHHRRALELSPASSVAHDHYGNYLENMGRFDDAIAHRRRALELDPFSPAMNKFLAIGYHVARRHREAIEQLQKTLDLYPNDYWAHGLLSVVYAQIGARQEALRHAGRALALSPALDDPALLGVAGWVYGVTGERSEASRLLGILNRLATQTYVDPVWVARLLLGLNDEDGAIEAITRAVTQRSPSAVGFMVWPDLDPLRDDPRFQELVRRMNFPAPVTGPTRARTDKPPARRAI